MPPLNDPDKKPGYAFLLALPLILLPTAATAQDPSSDERARVMRIVRQTPLIDGHNDLPWTIRDEFGGDLDRVDLRSNTKRAQPALHTDMPRMREGGVGAQFWSVYVPADL